MLRLPGFVHQKGKPFTSRLIHVDDAPFPQDGSFDDYELKAFAFLPKLPKRKPSSSNGLGTLNTKAAKLLLSITQSSCLAAMKLGRISLWRCIPRVAATRKLPNCFSSFA